MRKLRWNVERSSGGWWSPLADLMSFDLFKTVMNMYKTANMVFTKCRNTYVALLEW
jgi:hypothetical protein